MEDGKTWKCECKWCQRTYYTWSPEQVLALNFGSYDYCSTRCKTEAEQYRESKKSQSIIGSVFVLGLLMGVIQFLGFVFNHPDSNMDVKRQSQSSNQGYKTSCGDNDPNGSSLSWYSVFVNKTDQNTLNYIRQNYCGDAFIKYRESANRESIQVASFLDYSKADDFAKSMIRDSQINSGEVGEATQD